MRVLIQAWWLTKNGNTSEEYEDAFSPKNADQEADIFRFAIADGATEASFSKQWAESIVCAYCNGLLDSDAFGRTIHELRSQWLKSVGGKSLPWYAEEKLQMGAFSSLLGMTLHAPLEGKSARWEGLAIGDSCLFQVRNEELRVKWPLDASTQFNSRPNLLSTKPESNANLSQQTLSQEWVTGDLFYLMTDALAQWFLHAVEEGGSPKSTIPNFEPDSEHTFPEWVAELRDSGQLRNDDVTLMRVTVS